MAIIVLIAACLGSNQARAAITLPVSFQGEYQVGDGAWQPIIKGQSISAMDGDVTLKGYFQLEMPDGEVIGPVSEGTSIALYFDHIGGEVFAGGESIHVFDAENPLLGKSACGEHWLVFSCQGTETDPLEIVLHNPHKFGNYNAVNEFLNSMCIYSENSFENSMAKEGEPARIVGFAILVVGLLVLGVAIFSAMLRMRESHAIWVIGVILLLAGGYFILDTPNVSLWSDLVVFNTTAKQLCMMLYSLFMMCLMVKCLPPKTQKIGGITVAISGALVAVFFFLSLTDTMGLYDTDPYWAAAQVLAGTILLCCRIPGLRSTNRGQKLLMVPCSASIVALFLDIFATAVGWWQGAVASKVVFALLFVVATLFVLRVIPGNFRAAIREKELQAQLQESRISVMLSQIQPHFLYNSLTAVMDLCDRNPAQAKRAIADFAKYLRGNLEALGNRQPIPFSKELRHIEVYLRLEKLRFEDKLQVVYDIQAEGFLLPALTIQPLVENAVKHGLTEKEEGGTVTISTAETEDAFVITVSDDGVGFDTEAPLPEEHMGLENVKNRLWSVSHATLEVRSQKGAGTVATVYLPKGGNT